MNVPNYAMIRNKTLGEPQLCIINTLIGRDELQLSERISIYPKYQNSPQGNTLEKGKQCLRLTNH